MSAQVKDAPNGHWFWGGMSAFRANALQYLLDRATRGDITRDRFGPFPVLIVNSHEAIHDVLVTNAARYEKGRSTKVVLQPLLGDGLFISDGEFWKKQRKLVSPAFHTRRIANYADIMVDYAQRAAAKWQNGREIDVEDEMSEITMRIISKAGFDADVDGTEAELRHAVEDALSVVDKQFDRLLPQPLWWPNSDMRRYKRAIARLQTLIQNIINDRRSGRTGQHIDDKGDALSMLLMAQDDEGGAMADKHVRDEIMTLFGAGHETTAKALSWAWYALSQYPDIAAKLHAELDSVLGGRTPTIDDLPNLRYLDQFIKEVLRLYPPAWVTTRQPSEATHILGEPVAKAQPVIVNIYGAHHDPNIYENPQTFKPERWTEAFEKSLPKSAYIPFGNGPRICIGFAFAQMEAKLILAVLAQQFTLELRPGHPVEPQDMFTLRPKFGLPMTVRVREPARELA